jgi:hypothetical protein
MSGMSSKVSGLGPDVTERARRVWAATEARALGRGGSALVARATGISPSTITRGLKELRTRGRVAPARVRPGWGPEAHDRQDPTRLRDLEGLVEPSTSGDPESPLRWTAKSVRELPRALQGMGHRLSHQLVAELLTATGYATHSVSMRMSLRSRGPFGHLAPHTRWRFAV